MPIVVNNANRAPVRSATSPTPSSIAARRSTSRSARSIADGNPVTLTISGLPAFATYTQTSAPGSNITGLIHFAPVAGHRGDYTLTVVAQDNGDGDVEPGHALRPRALSSRCAA